MRALSNEALVTSLNGLLSSGRRLIALTVAHLGEVEERRLHLLAGHSSMFAYCTDRLGMSEDEAYRRIEVARLARGFPILLEMLAAGQVTLSVAALLKPYLTGDNHATLLEAVCGKTVRRAREVLAVWFPRPDVPASIRKLPTSRGGRSTVLAGQFAREPAAAQLALSSVSAGAASQSRVGSAPPADRAARAEASADADLKHERADAIAPPAEHAPVTADRGGKEAVTAPVAPAAQGPAVAATEAATPSLGERLAPTPHAAMTSPSAHAALVPSPHAALPRPTSAKLMTSATLVTSERATTRCIEPLSPDRYRVQLTASADLKRKLELARDLLRHAIPDGDLAAILERAVDLLIEQTMKRRFALKTPGKTEPATSPAPSAPCAESAPSETSAVEHDSSNDPQGPDDAVAAPPGETDLLDGSRARQRPPAEDAASVASRSAPTSRHITNDVRRAVLARDGLRCAWVAPDGTRCASQAWLEHDHITPRGQGGDNDATNIRHFCRPHNRLSAELAYGQATIDRIIQRRRTHAPPSAR